MIALFLKIISFRERFSRKDLARLGIPLTVLALIASVVTGREKPSQPEPQPAARIDTRVQAPEDLDLSKLFRAPMETKEGAADAAVDPFSRRSFSTPQQNASAAPAAPTAPPLPFRYLGKAIEDGKLAVFLARGDESYSVHARQKIDEQYRVDKVSEQAVTFTYLPMNQKQTLEIR